MKKLISLITAALALTLFTPCAYADSPIPAAEEVPPPKEEMEAEFFGTVWNGEDTDTKDLLVTGCVTVSADAELNDKDIRIEENGIIEVTGGAHLVLNNTHLYIENGGSLIISNGTVTLNGQKTISGYGEIENNGSLIICTNGTLDISSGTFSTHPTTKGCVLINNGKLSITSEKLFKKAIAKIKKYDKNFRLSDYSIFANAYDKSNSTIYFQYCIDGIETDHQYTARIGKKAGVRITRSRTDLSTVYDKELRNKLLDRVYSYESAHDLPDSFYEGINRRSYYLYDFSDNSLMAEYVYFGLVFESDGWPIIMEGGDHCAIE